MKTNWLIIILLSIAALSASALPPPEKEEMLLTELEQKMFDFDGKIIEIEVTYATSLEQKSSTEYRAYCYCYTGSGYAGGASVYFSKDDDAMEFFQELIKRSYGSGLTSFYVQVDGEKFIAVGEKFKKSKGIYTW